MWICSAQCRTEDSTGSSKLRKSWRCNDPNRIKPLDSPALALNFGKVALPLDFALSFSNTLVFRMGSLESTACSLYLFHSQRKDTPISMMRNQSSWTISMWKSGAPIKGVSSTPSSLGSPPPLLGYLPAPLWLCWFWTCCCVANCCTKVSSCLQWSELHSQSGLLTLG